MNEEKNPWPWVISMEAVSLKGLSQGDGFAAAQAVADNLRGMADKMLRQADRIDERIALERASGKWSDE